MRCSPSICEGSICPAEAVISQLLPGVVEGLQRLRAAGYSFAIVTNQSGIGRGYYSEQDYHDFQQHLLADLASFGISIEGSYFCPHRPHEGCGCRKPELAMLHLLSRELGADLTQCWMVGDGLGDVLVAERAGGRGGGLVATGRGGERLASRPGRRFAARRICWRRQTSFWLEKWTAWAAENRSLKRSCNCQT